MADEIKPPKLSAPPGNSGAKSHRGLIIGGVVILVGGAAYLLLKHRGSSSSSTTSSSSNTATPQVIYPSSGGGTGGSGYTGYGVYNALSSTLAQNNQNLAAQLSSINATQQAILDAIHAAGNPGAQPNPTKPTQPTITSTYTALSSWTAAKAANATGITLYDKVAPGVFGKITPSHFHPTGGAKGGGGITTLAPGSGLYVRKP